jgi:hypothetical protein
MLWTARCLSKTNPKLIINSNAVLAFAIAFERFQSIPWRRSQKAQRFRGIKHRKFSSGRPRNSSESPALPMFKQRSRVDATEASNHRDLVLRHTIIFG